MTRHDTQIASTLKLPPALQKDARALIELQMWCWGCDVRRPEGNLFLEYGFTKHPAPTTRLHSAYTLHLDTAHTITLWGWGVWIAAREHGSLFIDRSAFRIRHTAHADLIPQAWQACDLHTTDASNYQSAYVLLHTALCWTANYERWVSKRTQPHYRSQTLAASPCYRRLKWVARNELAPAWESLVKQLAF